METINKNCRDCKKPFSISPDEQKWLKEKGFQEFSRCSECRKKNKEKKSAAPVKAFQNTNTTDSVEKLVNWIKDRTDKLYEEQQGSENEREHNARNAHMDDLTYILTELT